MTIVFPHIPKTGGQSLRHHFNEHLDFNSEFVHMGPWGEQIVQRRNLTAWLKQSQSERNRAKILFGHFVKKSEIERSITNELKFVTVLRDPAKRWVSQYNFELALNRFPNIQNMSFWDYFKFKNNPNFMTNFIATQFLECNRVDICEKFSRVSDELDKFEYVANLDEFDKFAEWLNSELDLPQITTKHNVSSGRNEKNFVPSEQDLARIAELCPWDYKLIERFS